MPTLTLGLAAAESRLYAVPIYDDEEQGPRVLLPAGLDTWTVPAPERETVQYKLWALGGPLDRRQWLWSGREDAALYDLPSYDPGIFPPRWRPRRQPGEAYDPSALTAALDTLRARVDALPVEGPYDEAGLRAAYQDVVQAADPDGATAAVTAAVNGLLRGTPAAALLALTELATAQAEQDDDMAAVRADLEQKISRGPGGALPVEALPPHLTPPALAEAFASSEQLAELSAEQATRDLAVAAATERVAELAAEQVTQRGAVTAVQESLEQKITAEPDGTLPVEALPEHLAPETLQTAFAEANQRAAAAEEAARAASGGLLATGLDSTGATDVTTALETLMAQAEALPHKTLSIPPGTYRLARKATVPSGGVRLHALGPITWVRASADGLFEHNAGWDFLGTASGVSVTGIATAKVDLVPVGEASGVSSQSTVSVLTTATPVTLRAGDIVKVVSEDINPYGRPELVPKLGEYAYIGKDYTGTQPPLTHVLREPFDASVPGNVRLVRSSTASFSLVPEGSHRITADPSIMDTPSSRFTVLLRGGAGHQLAGVEFDTIPGRAVGNFAFGTVLDRSRFIRLDNRVTLGHYGYGVQDGGCLLSMIGCYGLNFRHLYSEGNGTQGEPSTSIERYGGGFYAMVAGNRAAGAAGQPYDTHGTAVGTSFVGNSVQNIYVGASSGGIGLSIRGRDCFVANNVIDGCQIGMRFSGSGTRGVGNVVRRAIVAALQIVPDTDDGYLIGKIAGGAAVAPVLRGISDSHGSYEVLAGSEAIVVGGGTAADGYAMEVRLENPTARILRPEHGARAVTLRPGTTGTVDLALIDPVFDWSVSQGSGTLGVAGVSITGPGARLFVDRLDWQGGSAPYTSATLIDSVGGDAATVEALNMRYRHTSVSPTPIKTSITKARGTWTLFYGSSWFTDGVRSCAWSQAASASVTVASVAVVAEVARRADRSLSLRVTTPGGTAADATVTLPQLPAYAHGARAGTQLSVFNDHTGPVVIPATGLRPNAAITLASYEGVLLEYGGDFWRRIK